MKNKLLIAGLAGLLTIILLAGCVSRVTTDPQTGKSYIQSLTNKNKNFQDENFLNRDISHLMEIKYHELGIILQRIQVKDFTRLKMYYPSGYTKEMERLDGYVISSDDYRDGYIIYLKFFNGNNIIEEGYIPLKK